MHLKQRIERHTLAVRRFSLLKITHLKQRIESRLLLRLLPGGEEHVWHLKQRIERQRLERDVQVREELQGISNRELKGRLRRPADAETQRRQASQTEN